MLIFRGPAEGTNKDDLSLRDSTLELSVGHLDGPLESTRIPEDLVQTATHLRAPVHPTCFLSPPSIVVLELSTGQSLVLSVCLDGDWLELSGTR